MIKDKILNKKTLFLCLGFVLLLVPFFTKADDRMIVKITTKKGLYVRERATTKSSIRGGIIYNSSVQVSSEKYFGDGCSNGFYKITNGKYSGGYICSNYVSKVDEVKVINEDLNKPFDEKVVSVTTGLNLRSEANKSSDKLTTLAKNKNYIATERVVTENSGCKNDIWYKIQVNDKSGYVCSAYLREGASTDNYVSSCNHQIDSNTASRLGVNTNETFVEVDLTKQEVTLYKDGICNIISSTVTGKEDPEKEAIDTIPGSFRVTEKTRNKFFKSSNVYSNYWMRFNLGMGLHDADNWRSTYGYRGSHGCVNLPLSASKIIYDSVDVGTRVIVHK